MQCRYLLSIQRFLKTCLFICSRYFVQQLLTIEIISMRLSEEIGYRWILVSEVVELLLRSVSVTI